MSFTKHMVPSVALVPVSDPRGLQERISTGSTPVLFCDNIGVAKTFWDFFTASIRNKNTRIAYLSACYKFADWCENHQLSLLDIEPIHVGVYIDQLLESLSAATVKQNLSAITCLFGHLVVNGHLRVNPARAVRPPKHVVTQGKTPILTPEEMHDLFDSIKLDGICALRDRAIIAVMAYSFARVSAVCGLNVADYYTQGKRAYFTLSEKGGKYNKVPAHRIAQDYVDAYIDAAGIAHDSKLPLFRTMVQGKNKVLSTSRVTSNSVLRMVKRRCRHAGLPPEICNHSFRGTGITTFMKNGGALEIAARIAGHTSTETTQLYDRRSDEVSLDEIERIRY